ncbi:hypothetical protein C8Q73DRAFT_7313 [Cubamyces lactineus]|nr:hypothetical protein C8Q73DRAFT_7313 [Cubamyces lactineus]
MHAATAKERLDFINALDIHNVPKTAVAQDTADVVANSALYFVQSVTGTMKADVVNSILLAYLTASKMYDRQADRTRWYGYYTQVLGQLGWVVQEFSLTEMNNVAAYSSIDQIVVQYSAAFLAGTQLAQLTSMINALKEPRNKEAESIFNARSKEGKSANFQLGVTWTKGTNPYMSIAAFAYTSSKEIDSVLFDPITDPKMTFYAGHQTMFLDEDIYSQIRESVLEKLGGQPIDKLAYAIEL